MKKRSIILTVLVFALIICATIQPTISYFTTYVRAKGGHQVSIGDTTTISEKYSNFKKEVKITNKVGSEPVYIRAKVIFTDLNGKEIADIGGEGWTAKQGDGYYYYSSVNPTTSTITVNGRSVNAMTGLTALDGGETTSVLNVEFENLQPEKPEKGFGINVTVVYESTPVRYDTNGNPYADWDAKIVKVDSTTGGNG